MKLLALLLLTTSIYASEIAVKCLAQNIYFESRGSNLADQAAVADVVMNRVESSRYPNTVCGVIHQYKQFSWYWDGKSDRMTDTVAAKSAYYLAHQMLTNGRFRGISEGADHYHATYVSPYWAKSFELIGQIGQHKFYRTH